MIMIGNTMDVVFWTLIPVWSPLRPKQWLKMYVIHDIHCIDECILFVHCINVAVVVWTRRYRHNYRNYFVKLAEVPGFYVRMDEWKSVLKIFKNHFSRPFYIGFLLFPKYLVFIYKSPECGPNRGPKSQSRESRYLQTIPWYNERFDIRTNVNRCRC